MFQRECLLYAWVLDYTRKLVADLDDAEMALQPAAGLNTPLWLLGHLAICTDYAAALLGLPMVCPKEWHQMFGPGSDPARVPTPHPNKKQLVDALGGRARLGKRGGASREGGGGRRCALVRAAPASACRLAATCSRT
ncbi:MAG: DinB family protein [Gemmataceae bacterium]